MNMKMESSSVKNSCSFETASRNNWKKETGRKALMFFGEKIPVRCQEIVNTILSSLGVVIFTAALFLSGSYLFFIQLAEYGW